ncbi:MAG TPA: hypothetical protein VK338_00790, partial [Candidatus Nitrosocosmicus sp.]|nr:hypothetical protein [Candidatus Nitrosocosmicus sp.]
MNKPTLFSTNELQEIVHNFVDELQKSANGISTSISYIRNTVPKKNLQNEVIQCMIMGGTIFEKALVLRNGKNVEILSSEKIPMPVMKDINIFTDLILQQLDSTVSKVGFCLAYPLEPVFRENILDGKLLRGTKEHNFEGLVGRNVGETLEAIIEKRTGKKISISIANDTVCLVLAGRNYETSKEIAGGINGTGTNFGFAESSEIIVNLESGNFNRFKISDACMAIDGSSNNPNKQLFEKEVSGGYLYRLFSYYHPEIHISSTEELSQIAQS